MKYGTFNSKTQGELKISKLGMGCMRLPVTAPGGEEIDYDRADEVIDYAYKNGINYFDTAMGYHNMGSEPFLGHSLSRYPRESFFLATKLSTWFLAPDNNVENIFAKQQERLNSDYFDFYLCHNLNDNTFKRLEDYDAYAKLSKYKEQGKIRHLGFSFHGDLELLETVIKKYEWDFAQIQFNYLDARFGNAMREYEMLTNAGIPVIVMEPVRGGSLADLCEEANSMLKNAQPDKSIASWAIRFAASHENVMTTLSGMSNLDQVKDNVATMSDFTPLSQQEKQLLEDAADIFKKYYTVPCTECKYCMDTCPMNVNVPELLKVYGHWKLHKNGEEFKEKYMNIDEQQRADSCIGCASCEEKCPQSIKISDIMSEMKELSEQL